MRNACCITKATKTHSEYVILVSLPLQQWLENAPQCDVMRAFSVLLFASYTDSEVN
jgi:hypothetical protein